MTIDSGDTAPPQEKKRSKLKTAWKFYSWGNRIRQAPDWYSWFLSFLQTKAGTAAALGTVAAATTTAAVVSHDLVNEYSPAGTSPGMIEAPVTPAPQAAKPLRQTKNTQIYAIEGRDTAGRRGTFDVVVAKKEFLWVRGSSDEIEKDGKAIAANEISAQVFDSEMQAALANARELIAVGTASQEGNAEKETARARRRAERTAEIVTQEVEPAMPVSILNLGQYREPCENCETDGTNWQRPFMLIAVKDLENQTVLGEALADAMSGEAKLPSPKSYSTFDLRKFP
jgi:hypothetical protein